MVKNTLTLFHPHLYKNVLESGSPALLRIEALIIISFKCFSMGLSFGYNFQSLINREDSKISKEILRLHVHLLNTLDITWRRAIVMRPFPAALTLLSQE